MHIMIRHTDDAAPGRGCTQAALTRHRTPLRLLSVASQQARHRQAAQRLRHVVYAQQLGWEPHQPGGLECDRFDAQAWHMLVRPAHVAGWVATSRLIPLDPNAGLPALAHLSDVARACVSPANGCWAEWSRLAIDTRACIDRRQAALITERLFETLLSTARRLGINRLLCLSDAALLRKLSHRVGPLQPIGDPVQLHGARQLVWFNPQSAASRFGPT